MANLSFLLQAITKSTHANVVNSVLNLQDLEKALISVAFARTAGVSEIEDKLRQLGSKATIFVGIRNEITSKQALKQLLALKVNLYVVDTGSRHIIFHPKIYLAVKELTSEVVIGSANLTFNGLYNNIEASTHIKLDLKLEADKNFKNSILESFESMINDHPLHVQEIKNTAEIDDLFNAGRVEDEQVLIAPQSVTNNGGKDTLPPMDLHHKKNSKPKLPKAFKTKSLTKSAKVKTKVSILPYLVWESKPLKERDLNIPKSTVTNPTGSIGLKKGLYEDIDHREYFYDTVFDGLTWTADKPGGTKLRAVANFELIISTVNYGTFDLQLSHSTDKTSRSYKQGNMMTNLHWGNAKQHVAKPHLLKRNLLLYRKDTNPPEYVIEID